MLKLSLSGSRSRLAALAGALAASVSFVGAANATYTPVGPPSGGEASTVQILDNTYGGIFTAQGENYANGAGITAVRIEDSTPGGAPTNLINTPTGDRDDQLWSDGIAQGVAEARFAGYSQSLGYFDGWFGGTYHDLLDVSGSGFNVTGDATIDFGAALGTPAHWRWARSGGDGGTWSSLDSDNAGDTDHMITYMITGLEGSEYQEPDGVDAFLGGPKPG